MLNHKFIMSAVFASVLVIGLGLGSSIFMDSRQVQAGAAQHPPTLQANPEVRFRYEEYLTKKGKRPLSWDCSVGQTDRVRYVSSGCFADHLVEIAFSQKDPTASARLESGGDAYFTDPKGKRIAAEYQMDNYAASGMRALLAQVMPGLPATTDRWQMPPYLSAVEACLSGQSFLAIRRAEGDSQYNRMANALAERAGFSMKQESSGTCM